MPEMSINFQNLKSIKNENPKDLEEDGDLYEHHSFTAAKGQEPLRVDKFLMNFIEMVYSAHALYPRLNYSICILKWLMWIVVRIIVCEL